MNLFDIILFLVLSPLIATLCYGTYRAYAFPEEGEAPADFGLAGSKAQTRHTETPDAVAA